MGPFWGCCKTHTRCNEQPYAKLLKNSVLRQDYDRYCEKSKSKSQIILTTTQKIEAFLKEMEVRDTVISPNIDKDTKFEDGTLMGNFWHGCKRGKKCDKGPFDKLLQNTTRHVF